MWTVPVVSGLTWDNLWSGLSKTHTLVLSTLAMCQSLPEFLFVCLFGTGDQTYDFTLIS